MKLKYTFLQLLFVRLGIALAGFTFCRLVFLGVNYHLLGSPTFWQVLHSLFAGIRFDISSITIFNSLLIFLHLIPLKTRNKFWYQRLLKFLFFAVNLPLFFINLADTFSFPFFLQRFTIQELFITETGKSFSTIFFAILETHWYVIPLLLLVVWMMMKIYRVTTKENLHTPKLYVQALVLLLAVPCVVIAIRGGLQYKPISIVQAAKYEGSKLSPVILNTPFSLLHSALAPAVPDFNYMPLEEAKAIYPCTYVGNPNDSFKRMNVVVILLESFSAEYTGALNPGMHFTPFLDSLSKQGLLFTHCYANGKSSIEGVPSVLGSMPSYYSLPFISSSQSIYNNTSFASLLKPLGYHTAFLYGSYNGTMEFDSYAGSAGYEKYLGLNEFPEHKKYESDWGIDDVTYLKYAKGQLDSMQEPFHASLFTLSSHHPFKLPQHYENILPKGNHPIYSTIAFTDLALRQFFEAASKSNWYSNTVFLLCGDHTGPFQNKTYWDEMNFFHIFALLYTPGGELSGRYNKIVQQTDFLPSVMQYLNYSGSFPTNGTSIFDSTAQRISVHKCGGAFSLIDSTILLQFSPGWKRAYNYKQDSLFEHGVEYYTSNEFVQREKLLKAVLRNYSEGLKSKNKN